MRNEINQLFTTAKHICGWSKIYWTYDSCAVKFKANEAGMTITFRNEVFGLSVSNQAITMPITTDEALLTEINDILTNESEDIFAAYTSVVNTEICKLKHNL